MNAPLPVPLIDPPTDLLAEAIGFVTPRLQRSIPLNERLRTFWAAVFAARSLAATDIVIADFMALAREVGLAADLGPHADETLHHVIGWALLGQNPFD